MRDFDRVQATAPRWARPVPDGTGHWSHLFAHVARHAVVVIVCGECTEYGGDWEAVHSLDTTVLGARDAGYL